MRDVIEVINEPETLVRRGAELLDEKVPLWWNRVKHDVNIRDVNSCVLRQVYGNYNTGLKILNLGHDAYTAAQYGFVCSGSYALNTCICPELSQLWMTAIKERREGSTGR